MKAENTYLQALGWLSGLTLTVASILWLVGLTAQNDAEYGDVTAGLWQFALSNSLFAGGSIAVIVWLAARGIVEQIAHSAQPTTALGGVEGDRLQ